MIRNHAATRPALNAMAMAIGGLLHATAAQAACSGAATLGISRTATAGSTCTVPASPTTYTQNTGNPVFNAQATGSLLIVNDPMTLNNPLGLAVRGLNQATVRAAGRLAIDVGSSTADGISAVQASNGATVLLNGGAGIVVRGTNSLLTGGGDESGLVAQGSGNARIETRGSVSIDTDGRDSRGISAFVAATNSVLLVDGATLTVRGTAARGLHANDGALIKATGLLDITHDGASSPLGTTSAAVYATSTAVGGGRIELTDLNVTANKAGVQGVVANQAGGPSGGTVDITGTADVRVLGDAAAAVVANGNGARVTVANGVLTASGNGGLGLATSGSGSTIELGGGTVTAQKAAVSMTGGDGQTVGVTGATLSATAGSVMLASGVTNSTLNLTGSTANAAAGQLLLQVTGSSGLRVRSTGSTLTGDVLVAPTAAVDMRLLSGSVLTGKIDRADLTTDATSRWAMTADSELRALNHAGVIDFLAPVGAFTPKSLTVGNLNGQGGGIVLNTVLGDSASSSDRVIVTGTATGTTPLTVRNAGGTGALTLADGIQVVDAVGAGTTAAGSFTLAGPVVAGAYEYLLARGGAIDANDWFLRSDVIPVAPPPPPAPPAAPPPAPAPEGPGAGPAPAPPPIIPAPSPRLYRPAVPGYVLGAAQNAELGFDMLGTLHARVGEQHPAVDASTGEPQTWVRLGGQKLKLAGVSRFDADSRYAFVQIGKDLHVRRDEDGGHARFGAMASYGSANSTFDDRLRPLANLASRTGEQDATLMAAGGYYTRYSASGGYLDVVGQVAHLRNQYRDSHGVQATQRGWGSGLSAEVGQPFPLGDSRWVLEPQAQLRYHHARYSAFSDAFSGVAAQRESALQGRVGGRLYLSESPAARQARQVYLTANLLHSFSGAHPEANVAGIGVTERLARSWAEIGMGLQWPLGQQTVLYGRLAYQKALGDDGERQGVAGNAGLRVRW